MDQKWTLGIYNFTSQFTNFLLNNNDLKIGLNNQVQFMIILGDR